MFWYLLYIVVFLLVLSDIQFRWKYRSLRRFPGPPELPFFGILYLFLNINRMMANAFRIVKQYGTIIKGSFGRTKFLIISDPDMMEFFLRSPKFTRKSYNYFFLKPWLGGGILNLEGAEWHKTRKMITPCFHFSILAEHVTMFHAHCDILIDVLRKEVNTGQPVDIYPKVVNFTLDITTETTLGIKTNMQNSTNQEYLNALHFMTDLPMARMLSIWKRSDFLYRLSPLYRHQQKCVKILEDFSLKAIEERKKILLNNSNLDNELLDSDLERKKKGIFMDILLNSTVDGQPLSDEKIKFEVNNIIFGGHDTTASTISTMIYALANNKHIQDKVVAELKEILGSEGDRPISMQELNDMRYMDMVIKEVLRFYGNVPIIGREVTEDVDYKGTIIPQGTLIVLFFYGMHRSSKFFDNPKEFNPERFADTSAIKTFTYVPFSAGPRNCLGQKYAVLEIKVTFAKLLRYFEFESAGPNHKMELKPEMVMKPVNGIYVKIKPRDF